MELQNVMPAELRLVTCIVIALAGLLKWALVRRDVQFSRRKDVLEYCQDLTTLDPIKAEVLCRQLLGAYLPVSLLRKVACALRIAVVATLQSLAEIWPLVDWDPRDGTVRWKKVANTDRKRLWKCTALWIIYFSAGCLGLGTLILIHLPSTHVTNYAAAMLWGFLYLVGAGVALWKTDTWGQANKLGDGFLDQINAMPEAPATH